MIIEERYFKILKAQVEAKTMDELTMCLLDDIEYCLEFKWVVKMEILIRLNTLS